MDSMLDNKTMQRCIAVQEGESYEPMRWIDTIMRREQSWYKMNITSNSWNIMGRGVRKCNSAPPVARI
jgi:hypothetical protein